ncbi:beta-lactamase/transpeptidase-like protein [Hyaloraphidium curvatum]|nr:beta-lactamase/transpeptidase-like protein [Hyaloraphidium curvatum]
MAGNPPARQFVQPRQRRIVFPDGVSHFYAASDAAVGPAEVALLDGSSALLSSAAKSEPVTHPAWVPTALPTRQPAGVPFPGPEPLTTAEHQKNRNPPRSLDPCGWPTGDIPPSAAAKLGEAIGDLESPAALEAMGRTFSLAVIHRGRLVHHQYGPSSSPTTRLVSWSMAKSFVHAMLGALVLRGILPFDLEVEAPLPEWKEEGKRGVAMRELVEMRSGRGFAEDYVDGDNSDVIQMLFRQGKDNPPGFALARPQVHPPGTAWYYSSGTSNILCLCISRLLPPGESLQSFFRSLLDSIGMRDADPRYDAQGVFVGSSFLYASALSFARMGLLYMRDGVWEGRRLLPQGWADTARTMQAGYPAAAGENFGYGWHWWVWMDPLVGGKWGAFSMNGHEAQYVVCVPKLDLVVVRLGKTPSKKEKNVQRLLARIVECFAGTEGEVAAEQGWGATGARL